MFCSRCGYQNRPEAKFCSRCGAPLSASQGTETNNQTHANQSQLSSQPGNANQTQPGGAKLKRHWTATLATIVWILTALANVYLLIFYARIGYRVGFGIDLVLAFLSAASAYDFFDGDREALYFATAAIVIAFIFDAISGAWLTVVEVIIIAIFTYLPANHLVKDGIKAHNFKLTGET